MKFLAAVPIFKILATERKETPNIIPENMAEGEKIRILVIAFEFSDGVKYPRVKRGNWMR